MQSTTLVLVLLAALASLAIVFYQYYFRSKAPGRIKVLLASCRFVAVFGIFLLLINPEFVRRQYEVEKANLVLLFDNSSSLQVSDAADQVRNVREAIAGNTGLTDRFRISSYSFGENLNVSDSLTFTEKTTNISKALKAVEEVYSETPTAVVVVTDGNQTLGEDYEYYGKNQPWPVYPIAVGDTTQYADIRIDQLNVNKYAFLKNKFPVEVYLSYQGDAAVDSRLTIAMDGQNVYSGKVSFSNTSNSKVISTLIPASSVGVKRIRAVLAPLTGERNTTNNIRNSAVEIIDEKTRVAIISGLLHPDIGALKKAIESNEQREVVLLKPNVSLAELDKVNLFMLYQPTASFRAIYEYIETKKANKFTITGSKTDWNFLNGIQNSFEKTSYAQSEDVSPIINTAFSLFDISGFSIQDFPPLEENLGDLLITKTSESILGQEIKGVDTNEPLMTLIENDNRKEAVLFGENIWKWRAQTYRNEQSFKNFDELIGKIVLYLASDAQRDRLSIDYETIYQGNSEAVLTAAYFDKAYVFDPNATISLFLQNDATKNKSEIPMLLMNGYYKADLGGLLPGQYSFSVRVKEENLTKSGNFSILDFDVEQQYVSTDYRKLGRLAVATEAALYFPENTGDLIADLLSEKQFVPIQKSNQNVVPLIDFKILLGLIIAALAAEWFIRKYNGLI